MNKNILIVGLSFVCIMLTGTIIWMGTSSSATTNSVEPTFIEETTESETVLQVETTKEMTSTAQPKYTEDELFCMAATIYNEAGGDYCSDDTRRLVAYVILNRVNDSRFPDTIRGVLEAKGQYGTFYYTGVKFADRCTQPGEKNAVNRAWRIAREVLESEQIPIPKTVVFQSQVKQGTSVYRYQDGMYFCHS